MSGLVHALLRRGQLSGEEVRIIMWQLVHALRFLHSNNVWHRCFT